MKRISKSDVMELVRKVYRLVRYPGERRRFWPEKRIRSIQNELISRQYNEKEKKLIVFLVPGVDAITGQEKISGGVMSIVSICEETSQLRHIHGADTIMCTINGAPLLIRHTLFENKTTVFRFEQLLSYFNDLQSVIIHVPEFLCKTFLNNLSPWEWRRLKNLEHVQINIMNQNIRFMPGLDVIRSLQEVAHAVTITTAHQKYCTQTYREYYKVPLHKLSVWISPEQYHYKNFSDKENLLLVSPDPHPSREVVLARLSQISGLKIQIIQNLTYEEYKATIARAKWALTFGEGLDGYFIEPVFSGAIAFAVYNEEFFTSDFTTLKTVYPSFDALLHEMPDGLSELNAENMFHVHQREQFQLCARYYSKETYRKNIEGFYKKEYTYG